MDCIGHGVKKSWTRLSNFHFHFQDYISNKGSNPGSLSPGPELLTTNLNFPILELRI